MPVQIRFSHNQVGCLVEARQSSSDEWQTVELLKYGETLDTKRTEREYLATLTEKNIEFQVVPNHEA